MIVELTVENLAIIDKAQLQFGPGLTVLTGETGAGKSLLIDALELVLGERADSDLVRSGFPKATVDLVVDLTDRPDILSVVGEIGAPSEGAALYLRREVYAEGRSQGRISGRSMPVSVLRRLGSMLVDLHGQHDHQSLFAPELHVGYLDDWIGDGAHDALDEVAESAERAQDAASRLSKVRSGAKERGHRIELLSFQVEEINKVGPIPGEFDELQSALSRLKNVERISQALHAAKDVLNEREQCAVDLVGAALKDLEGVTRFDPLVEEPAAALRDAYFAMEEAIRRLDSYSEQLEDDPDRLEEIASRLDHLGRLRRKYGANEEEILTYRDRAQRELAELSEDQGSEEDLVRRVEETREELIHAAQVLSVLRKEGATQFDREVEAQLAELGMGRAQFQTQFHERTPDENGMDEVEFLLSANLGESPKPLAKVGSGGEISRVMLAIKTVLAGRAGVPTLIFDEVDAGLSGRAAATVGRKLQQLSRHYQVLVITHSPQIAACADAHFRIEKVEGVGRMITKIGYLCEGKRVEEIARMLTGESLTESAMANARDLIASCR